MADEGPRMRITRSFTVARPAATVWAFFQDVPAVASCLPGAELVESRDDGVQRGRVGISLGPFKASFEGQATIKTDPETRSGHVEGRGVDKRGGSHSQMTLDYRLNDDAGATRVHIDVDLTLSGPMDELIRHFYVRPPHAEAASALALRARLICELQTRRGRRQELTFR
jgi:uncharacterized protein